MAECPSPLATELGDGDGLTENDDGLTEKKNIFI